MPQPHNTSKKSQLVSSESQNISKTGNLPSSLKEFQMRKKSKSYADILHLRKEQRREEYQQNREEKYSDLTETCQNILATAPVLELLLALYYLNKEKNENMALNTLALTTYSMLHKLFPNKDFKECNTFLKESEVTDTDVATGCGPLTPILEEKFSQNILKNVFSILGVAIFSLEDSECNERAERSVTLMHKIDEEAMRSQLPNLLRLFTLGL